MNDVSNNMNNESIDMIMQGAHSRRKLVESSASSYRDQQETVIPSVNSDPPITIEEALALVQGDPDKYAN